MMSFKIKIPKDIRPICNTYPNFPKVTGTICLIKEALHFSVPCLYYNQLGMTKRNWLRSSGVLSHGSKEKKYFKEHALHIIIVNFLNLFSEFNNGKILEVKTRPHKISKIGKVFHNKELKSPSKFSIC